MSRNKDIKYLHDVTGWSYKLCRQKMKDNNWDLWQALIDMANILADSIRNIDLSLIDIKPIGEITNDNNIEQ